MLIKGECTRDTRFEIQRPKLIYCSDPNDPTLPTSTTRSATSSRAEPGGAPAGLSRRAPGAAPGTDHLISMLRVTPTSCYLWSPIMIINREDYNDL